MHKPHFQRMQWSNNFICQLVYYIRLKFEIVLTFIFQNREWWNVSLLWLWQYLYYGGVYSMPVSNSLW